MSRRPRTVHAAALAAGFLTCFGPAIRSQDWYVDVNDPQCATGDGSLAHPFCNIQDAIDAAQSGDTVHVAPGAYLENLAVDRDLAIVGTGGKDVTIVDGSDAGPVATLSGGPTVALQGMTLTNGSGASLAGGIAAGAGATLTLVDSSIIGNRSDSIGGIDGSGTLTLMNATVSNNVGAFGPYVEYGGIAWSGSLTADHSVIGPNIGTGIRADGVLSLSHCTVSGNDGGLHAITGTMSLDSCIVDGNTCSGIRSAGATMTLTNCTISNNQAPSYSAGGGIVNNATMTLVNCTVSGNQAFSEGGGILNQGTLELTNCTVANNQAGYDASGGIRNTGTVTLTATILAGNSIHDCRGTLTSHGFNLIGDTTSCTLVGDPTGNKLDVDPLLGSLADNGGPTPTHALGAGSPARDAAGAAACPATDQRGVPRLACDMGAHEDSLALDIDPNAAGAASPVDFLTFAGMPGSPVLLFLRQVNGMPLSFHLFTSTLDGGGQWLVPLILPPGLESLDLTFQSFAFEPGGSVAVTNPEVLSIANIPDPCDPMLGSDCNGNGVLDDCDIADGVSVDSDDNGIPDECQLDIRVPDDALTFQDALDLALDGAVITVEDGTYLGTGNRDLDFLGKAVTLQSENGPQNCILDLGGLGRAFLFQSGEGPGSVVRGLTIRNGQATRGGAVHCTGSSPTIQQCLFLDNTASQRGGAVYATQSDLVLLDCTFARNVSTLEHGGGLALEGGNQTVRHCTFAGNLAHPILAFGGGLYQGDGVLSISHSVFWNNFAGQGRQIYSKSGTLSVDWCDVEGGWPGPGQNNLALDPLFVDAPNLDYHLGPGSPCIDAGDPAFLPLPGETDLDGEPRLQGDAVDLGADEAVP